MTAGHVENNPMTLRSLLVLLDRDMACADRTRFAIRLALRMDCHLTGLAPTGLADLPKIADTPAALTELAGFALERLHQQAQGAAQQFRDACRVAAVKSFAALVDEADPAQALVRHAHGSDLLIVSQGDPAGARRGAARALVEGVVLTSARPVLILPHAAHVDALEGPTLVAWDGSREAARALADALPLLCGAQRVHLVSWNEDGDEPDPALRGRLQGVAQWLSRHGVAAEVRIEAVERGIADSMLSLAARLECDLIVMGAYGHARWAERMLGGATRGLLAGMTVPVLMSH